MHHISGRLSPHSSVSPEEETARVVSQKPQPTISRTVGPLELRHRTDRKVARSRSWTSYTPEHRDKGERVLQLNDGQMDVPGRL